MPAGPSRLRFARFLEPYIIKEVKGYNVRKGIGRWKCPMRRLVLSACRGEEYA